MSNIVAAEELRLLIERVERLTEEKKNIADDIRDVFGEAKSRGFDPKIMREIIKLRAMAPEARREREAMIDTYRAALGMLDGTPLGRWAMERLKPKPPEPTDGDDEPPADGVPVPGDDGAAHPAIDDAPPPEPQKTVEEARQMGRDAGVSGQPVTSNPFPPYDERRAAWDEAWCAALGSDGMDIPDALRPKPKPKKGDEA